MSEVSLGGIESIKKPSFSPASPPLHVKKSSTTPEPEQKEEKAESEVKVETPSTEQEKPEVWKRYN